MKIFFYWKNNNSDGVRLHKMLESFQFDGEKETFHTINSLKNQLHREINSGVIVVILAADQADLSEVYSIRNLLHDSRLILILPDIEESTISKGFECYPRFVSYVNSDFTDVISVLNKMNERDLSSNL